MANNTVLARLAVEISANNANFGKALQQSQSQFRAFTQSVQGLGTVLGVSLGSAAVFSGLKYAVGVMSDFEKRMSEVKAITGATGAEFDSLKNSALQLGRSTQYSAEQVAELQVAYGRLGFSTKEINNATKATIDLATATGEDLAKSADIVGSVIRAFNLSAKDTTKVTDIMASSFNKTALGLDNFGEAMKYVAPIAAAANISLEDTTALLGALADAGIRGSSAGTSLRKIITDLAKDGRPLAERLKELADKGLSFSQANDEVGRTAYASLLVLTKATEKTNQLAEAFRNAKGETAEMARIMGDNLDGDVKRLTNSFAAFIATVGNTAPIRNFIQNTSKLLALFSDDETRNLSFVDTHLKNLAVGIKQSGEANEGLVNLLKELRQEIGKPFDTSAINELIRKYGLTDSQGRTLKNTFDQINNSLSEQERILKQFNEFSERNGYKDQKKAAEDYINSIYKLIGVEQERIDKNEQFNGLDPLFEKDSESASNAIAGYKRVIAAIEEYSKSSESSGVTSAEVLSHQVESIASLKAKLAELEKAREESNKADEIGLAIKGDEIDKLKEQISLLESLRTLSRAGSSTTPTNDNVPSLSGQQFIIDTQAYKGIQDQTKAVNELSAAFQKNAATVGRWREGMSEAAAEIKRQYVDIGKSISQSISSGIADISFALGQSIAGVGNFGDAILRAIISFAKQLGEILISAGIAMLAAEELITNPYTAIAAGAALLIVAGAASAALSKSQSSFNSGGGGRSSFSSSAASNSSNYSSNGFEIQVGGEFTVRGNDLVYIFNRQTQLNKRTKG